MQQKEQELDSEQKKVLKLQTEYQQLNRQLNDQRDYSRQTSQRAKTAQNEIITLRGRLRQAKIDLEHANQRALKSKKKRLSLKHRNHQQVQHLKHLNRLKLTTNRKKQRTIAIKNQIIRKLDQKIQQQKQEQHMTLESNQHLQTINKDLQANSGQPETTEKTTRKSCTKQG